jgi:vitamin B12/bleomycin/antimicrobial peptide transport system ATP-binding/permease protein
MSDTFRIFLADLWVLTRPYWFSRERWVARGLLALVIGLNLGLVYVEVLLSYWQNDFYNTLQDKDEAAFFAQMTKFCWLAGAFIVVAVYRLYFRQLLQIKWREWLTIHYLGEWTRDQTYYRLQLDNAGTDNPDQRVAEDLNIFCDQTLRLTLDLLSQVVTLFSFLFILWQLSGTLSFALSGTAIDIPGYMVWVALVYAILGTWLAHHIGRPLVGLNFEQQKVEANFRFALMRFRENTEAIALYRGEGAELRGMKHCFTDVITNWLAIMRRTKLYTSFNVGYNQIAVIFPFLVAAPRFFTGRIQLGDLMQTATAFNKVQSALSWFVDSYTELAHWKATVDRLTTFHGAMRAIARESAEKAGIAITDDAVGHDYRGKRISIALPNGKPLLAPFDVDLKAGVSVLITGASGSGKSTLFRAFAGIWPFGEGAISKPRAAKVMFLPQKPYLTIGSLREQLCYPSAPADFDDQTLRAVLDDCHLSHLRERLAEEQHWAQLLSGGEQQRVAFARVVLHRPDWLFMDEATSALDEATENALYSMLQQQLPNTTVISIGHRASLRRFHQRQLQITSDPGGPGRLAGAPGH